MKLFGFKKNRKSNSAPTGRQPGGITSMSGQRVNSYYTASKKQITTFQRHAETERKRSQTAHQKIKKYGLLVTIGTLAVLVIVGMLTLNSTASISIEDGQPYRSPAEYQQVVSDALSSNAKNRIKFLLDGQAASQLIKNRLPEAYDVAVYAPLFGRNPEVIIKTSPPFATLLQSNGAASLILSSHGRLVVEAGKSAIDTSVLPTITNQSGTDYKVGDQLFKPDEMTMLHELQFQYTKGDPKQGNVAAYILPLAPREIHAKEGAYIAKFSLGQDVDITQQFGALRAVQAQLQSQNKTPSSYIDVRLGTKVYIK